ncbi:MAG: chromosome segregation protein SMC [Faecalimonas sp.]|nr:chromosome segregation protein SMC [Faecalimonas sp.]
MYLKSIEVHGFKSFANKIVFDFHNGITGIVGPNGSGKSNVADAVRWVLGEQRVKQLRGGNMQDVIFSGTELRKPLSYASVAITLDNSDRHLAIDYNEVTIARKLYRSGESEYLMNGTVCRLKDVNELFYDTGIGKEGYSIIGQGQIDKILSGKPEDRRELFDEAAGIVKFKRRKNMSLKKLEEERQNLVRVNDILSELEKRVGPLSRQAETAKTYLRMKSELKTYDINMFLLETARLKEELAAVEEKLAIAKGELDETSAKYENTKTEYESIEVQAGEIDLALEQAKRQLNETKLLKQQLEGQIEVLKEQINTARMNDEHLEQRSKAIYAELSEREERMQELAKEKVAFLQQLSSQKERDAQAEAALLQIQTRIAELAGTIENNKQDLIELLNNRSSTKANIQKFDTLLEQIQVRRSALHQRLIVAQSEVSRLEGERSKFEEELKAASDTILGYTNQIQSYEDSIENLQNAITQKSEKLRERQMTYHREASRLESLKNMTERYEGYGNSIRRVMEKKEQNAGILGVVADLVKAPKEYEVAIETALGGSIQNIVTSDEEVAKQMIAYLKQNKFGRATFLPLTTIKGDGGKVQKDALEEKGVIGLASSLVKVDEKYRGLAENLLGRTLVVKNIDNGIALARKYKQSLRIVTLEGELMNPGGAMTGGAFKNASNLLSRRREIEDLEKRVAQLNADLKALETEIEKNKSARTDYYTKVEAVKAQLQDAFVVQNTAKMNLNQVEAQIAASSEETKQIHTENDDLEQQIQEIKENHESIYVELEFSEKREQELSNSSDAQQKALEEAREEESKQLQETEKMHLSSAALEQNYQFMQENEARIQEEIQKFQEELAQLDVNKGGAIEEIRQKEEQIADIQATIANSGELFVEIESEIQKYTAQRESLNKQHKAFLEQREELSKRMSDLDKEVFRLNSKREGYEKASEKQIDYMWEEYELTYSKALEIRDENLNDLAFMKNQIQSLKNDIKALGPVNVNAIEDYKEVAERYEFLKTQHDDLIEAEATLVKIIEELDAAMRKQFKESFAQINEEYDKVFKQLFGGGKGTLELIEDEDVLEAGIRIIAQPPGKKLQNMMQLSGGEKALTAISLLFAIQNLKPSPFCLLDEIEAALDDSNVERFAKYLHKLTKHTQFIVITHRKGTMTAADRLYGITMQEKGVSALVSVDLLEKDLDD